MRQLHILGFSLIALSLLAFGCDSDPTSDVGEGTAVFTTWGEEYIEEGIPTDPEGQEGFIDGWTVHFDKFLVNFHEITVADANDRVGAASDESYFVDNTVPGSKELVRFADLEAKAWAHASYQIKPARADAVVVAGAEDDLAMMVENGYSIYVEGSAEKGSAKKTFHWGFTLATQYKECHSEKEGKDTLGIVITNGATDTSELTTHGDHFFYDRLQASPNPEIRTSLRFDEKAEADDAGNGDGEITIEELNARPIDVKKYDPSGLHAPTLGAFMTSLVRTVGHFRGEGECAIGEL